MGRGRRDPAIGILQTSGTEARLFAEVRWLRSPLDVHSTPAHNVVRRSGAQALRRLMCPFSDRLLLAPRRDEFWRPGNLGADFGPSPTREGAEGAEPHVG